jgi:transcriptional regulator with XRE-family HTH domain
LQAVRDIRLKRGLSQADLGRRAGITEYTISEIEAGKRTPRPSTLRKLAKGLDVDVATFTPGQSGLAQALETMRQGAALTLETIEDAENALARGETETAKRFLHYAKTAARHNEESIGGMLEIESRYPKGKAG